MIEFKDKKIVVIGDVGLDQYIVGEVKRISPEAPVPVVDAKSSDERLGLAANVANNVVALGGTACLISVAGADGFAGSLRGKLDSAGITHSLVTDPSRHTTRKLRLMSGHHHIARIDFENTHTVDKSIEGQVIDVFKNATEGAHAIIIEDYAKGLLSEYLLRYVITYCNTVGIPVIVDPNKKTPSAFYKNATMLTPNLEEARILTGLENMPVKAVGLNMLKSLELQYAVITQGADGMALFTREHVNSFPALAHKVYDVTGAGDTVVAALALTTAAKMPIDECVALANMAASVVVEKVGTSTCSSEELQKLRDSFTK